MSNKILHQHFDLNTLGNDYVVGDIHGCYSLLAEKLVEIDFDESVDRLFCVGDLVDRGGESIEVLDWLTKPWFHSVLGNHDLMAIEFYESVLMLAQVGSDPSNGYRLNYIHNGGEWFIKLPNAVREIVAKAFKELPITIDIDTKDGLVGLIHAECPFNDWERTKNMIAHNNPRIIESCIWSRNKIRTGNTDVVTGVHKVYNGHTVVKEPVMLGNRHYIDTGAVFYGNFTIIKL